MKIEVNENLPFVKTEDLKVIIDAAKSSGEAVINMAGGVVVVMLVEQDDYDVVMASTSEQQARGVCLQEFSLDYGDHIVVKMVKRKKYGSLLQHELTHAVDLLKGLPFDGSEIQWANRIQERRAFLAQIRWESSVTGKDFINTCTWRNRANLTKETNLWLRKELGLP